MKKRNVRVTTDVGTALWPHLNEPDTKFNKDGDYKVNLILSPDGTDKLRKVMNEVLQEFVSSGNAKTKKMAPLPIKEATDKEGKPTGDFEVKFKLRAVGTSRGERWEQRPALFDASGSPVSERVGNGSKIKVACEVVPYSTAIAGTGITLRLRAVQIIELQSVPSGDSFDAWGFSAQDGFTSQGVTQSDAQDDEDESGDGYDW